MDDGYAFESLPLEPVRAGTNVLVSGPVHAGARRVALSMLAGTDREGVVLVSTNKRAGRAIEDLAAAGVDVSSGRVGVIDCVGTETEGFDATVMPASGPGDLTGIGIRFSKIYQQLHAAGHEKVRGGFVSVTTLLSFSELRTVSRFVHTVVGRIEGVGGLGVFLVDPESQDDRSISTIAQFCDAILEVRETDDGEHQLRIRGVPDQDREWREFDPYL